MQLELIIRNADLARILRNYADRRLHFALSRFGDRVDRVSVTISEYTEAQSNAGRSCQISADLKPFGQVVAEEIDPDVYAAIDRAASRVGRLLAARLERGQEMPSPISRLGNEKSARKRRRALNRTPLRSLQQVYAGSSFGQTGCRPPRTVVAAKTGPEIRRSKCRSN